MRCLAWTNARPEFKDCLAMLMLGASAMFLTTPLLADAAIAESETYLLAQATEAAAAFFAVCKR